VGARDAVHVVHAALHVVEGFVLPGDDRAVLVQLSHAAAETRTL
jgi:hypothetical protein